MSFIQICVKKKKIWNENHLSMHSEYSPEKCTGMYNNHKTKLVFYKCSSNRWE